MASAFWIRASGDCVLEQPAAAASTNASDQRRPRDLRRFFTIILPIPVSAWENDTQCECVSQLKTTGGWSRPPVDADDFIAAVDAGAVARSSGDGGHDHDVPGADLDFDPDPPEFPG